MARLVTEKTKFVLSAINRVSFSGASSFGVERAFFPQQLLSAVPVTTGFQRREH